MLNYVKRFMIFAILNGIFCSGFSQTITISSLKKNKYCEGDTIWIPFGVTGSFDSGNKFKIEVGSENGIYSPQPIYISEKTDASKSNDSIMFVVSSTLPGGLSVFTCRVVSTNPVIVSNTSQAVSLFMKPQISFDLNDTVLCTSGNPLSLSLNVSNITPVFSGDGIVNNKFLPSIAGEGFHTIYCKLTDLNGCSFFDSSRVKVVNTPKAFLLTDEYISLYPTKELTAYGTNIKWFSDSAMTQFLYNGETLAFQMVDTGAHNLYITQTLNNCSSIPVKMVVIYRPKVVVVKCKANIPTLDSKSMELCEGDTSTITTFARHTAIKNIRWYDASNIASANLISKDSVMIFTRKNEIGTWIYYAYEYDSVNKCYSSSAAEFSFIVRPHPVITMILDDTVCFSAKPFEIPVIPSGGTFLGPGIDETTNIFTPGLTNAFNSKILISYNVTNDYGCMSTLLRQVFVHYVYLPTSMDMTGYLDSIPEMFAIGDDSSSIVRWYSDLNSQPVNVGEYYKPNITALGDYTYFVSQENKGCLSDDVPITLSIVPGHSTGNDIKSIKDDNIEVGPNPANKYLNVKGLSNGYAEIVSIIGSKIADVKIENGKINIESLIPGVYLLKTGKGSNKHISKFIKE